MDDTSKELKDKKKKSNKIKVHLVLIMDKKNSIRQSRVEEQRCTKKEEI